MSLFSNKKTYKKQDVYTSFKKMTKKEKATICTYYNNKIVVCHDVLIGP